MATAPGMNASAQGCSTASFTAAANFAAGDGPISVATGDFNGDGKLDLATANNSSNNVSVLLGNGKGGFDTATNFGVGIRPQSVTTGDFDGDGKLDLATANEGSDNISVLLNSCTASTPPVITCPASIMVKNDAGQCSALVSLTGANAATATGTPAPVISYEINGASITSQYSFPAGQTTVTAVATNGAGTDRCSFTVTVTDNEQPQITCPLTGNAVRSAGTACTYTVSGTEFNATATDNCSITSLTYRLSGATTGTGTSLTGKVLNKGVTTVTWAAGDDATLSKTCSFTVTVQDNGVPVITTKPNPVALLWPPNHKYQTVTAAQAVMSISDYCDGAIPASNALITK